MSTLLIVLAAALAGLLIQLKSTTPRGVVALALCWGLVAFLALRGLGR